MTTTKGRPVRVLLVDDCPRRVRTLGLELGANGFAVDTAADGEEADAKCRRDAYDIVILDVALPKVDGLTLLKRWRTAGIDANVVFLSDRGTRADMIAGLDNGADCYMTKPFDMDELSARLRALTRRRRKTGNPVIRCYDLEIDTAAHAVRRAGRLIHLTRREYALLEVLALHRGEVVGRKAIWQHLCNGTEEYTSNIIDVYIRSLRKKIDEGHDTPLVLTRWGEGYLLRGGDGPAAEAG
jgi:DNA-binding response OmpR family regulator